MLLPTLVNLVSAAALATQTLPVHAAGATAAADASLSCAQISAELKRLGAAGVVTSAGASDVNRQLPSPAPHLLAGPGAAAQTAARSTAQPVRTSPISQADLLRQEHLMGLALAKNCR